LQIFLKYAIFLFKKIAIIRKYVRHLAPGAAMTRLPLPTEAELVNRLRRGEVAFPPLSLAWEVSRTKGTDGVLSVKWRKKTFRFAAECRRAVSPKAVAEAINAIRERAQAAKLSPLVVLPYLDDPTLDRLEAEAVSGLDLCGNGVVVVPDELYLRRTGGPNRFKAEGAIKNVYRGSSSVVARLFLTRPDFDSVQEALGELTRRGGGVTLATVSKVCKRLEEDLIVERKRGGVTSLRLVQPEKLLDQLAANYVAPRVTTRVAGKLGGTTPSEFRAVLRNWAGKPGNRMALAGSSSVSAYAVMARDGAEEFYCSDVTGLLRALGDRFQPAERFSTVALLETGDEEVYFDRREDLTASPVQTFLELSRGDKRDQETAAQVRRVVMSAVSPRAAK
jgi:hypothetical protein